jgi:hypothetical protein
MVWQWTGYIRLFVLWLFVNVVHLHTWHALLSQVHFGAHKFRTRAVTFLRFAFPDKNWVICRMCRGFYEPMTVTACRLVCSVSVRRHVWSAQLIVSLRHGAWQRNEPRDTGLPVIHSWVSSRLFLSQFTAGQMRGDKKESVIWMLHRGGVVGSLCSWLRFLHNDSFIWLSVFFILKIPSASKQALRSIRTRTFHYALSSWFLSSSTLIRFLFPFLLIRSFCAPFHNTTRLWFYRNVKGFISQCVFIQTLCLWNVLVSAHLPFPLIQQHFHRLCFINFDYNTSVFFFVTFKFVWRNRSFTTKSPLVSLAFDHPFGILCYHISLISLI